MSDTKQCSKCRATKPLTDFYRSKATEDGRQTWCKLCQARYSRGAKRRESTRSYNASDRGRAARRRYDQSQKGHVARQKYEHSEKGKRIKQRYRKRRRKRIRARDAINKAVSRDKLAPISTQPCADCGMKAEVYHHDDYSQPMDVVPLCRRCDHLRHH